MADGTSPSAFEIVTARRTSAPLVTMQVNGAGVSITNSNVGHNNATGDFRIGNRSGGSEFANMEVCELIIFERALENSDLAKLYQYLRLKWAI